MLTHVFFDLDGTLVDSLPGISASANAAIAEILPNRRPPDFRPFIGPKVRAIFQIALSENDPVILAQLEDAFRRHYDQDGYKRTKPYPGVVETLEPICRSGTICCVLTNKPMHATRAILRHLALDSFFADVLTPDSHLPPYPSKTDAALDAKQRYRLKGEDAIVIGDSADDRQAAKACGFRFVATTFGYGAAYLDSSCPLDLKITRFEEVLSIPGLTLRRPCPLDQ